MKEYTEIVKEKNKNYHYLYCGNCKSIYIDDLFYILFPKICPDCKILFLTIKSEQPLKKQQVQELGEKFIKQKNLEKVRKNNLVIN